MRSIYEVNPYAAHDALEAQREIEIARLERLEEHLDVAYGWDLDDLEAWQAYVDNVAVPTDDDPPAYDADDESGWRRF